MAIREVLIFPDSRLHIKASPVVSINDEIKQLVTDMIETMYAYHGCGLAATQINIPHRVIVMDLSADGDVNNPLIFINPEILERSGEIMCEEGCVSVPGIYEKVLRAARVRFKYLDLGSDSHEIEAEGLMSQCIQHEIDHLNGKVFVEYLSGLKQNFIRKKMKKLIKAM